MNTFLQMSCLESTLILEEFTSLFGKLVPGHGDSSIFLPLRVCIYASNKLNVPKFQQITGVAFPACTFSHDSCLSYIKQSGILLAKCTNGNSFPFLSPKRNVRCQLHFHPEQSQATCKPNKKKWRFLEATLHSGRPRKESLGALTRHWQELSKLDPLQHGITKATNPNPPRACKWQKLFGCHSSGSK